MQIWKVNSEPNQQVREMTNTDWRSASPVLSVPFMVVISLITTGHIEVINPENEVELEEKTRLINQVLELQHTLEELSARVDAVKEENLKLKSENQVLGQYIENLMSASSVFQTTDTKSKRK
ncbi:short coiled-coil protein B isoform X3 [Chiloscyllium plagiosum]|uniref:short coiled-coil protein B isoform X3 n=1 Tax=Chiloscyllium plagiosum TaxID=36176 RepID=UPI001CB821F7|nr:short coiled-coil protein B isoform X3 [Chiloscyllium plagiosum]XP_043530052.1 short coiled-coil protein B isoform X3 [Chiloscyllium plagiosum]XP_043530053.1 short coiled-coil protein B isoform X3 [Chiloscyllium plagiosum]XP_043530054.1 short coiled-coil protein B isoform X3 [Chiloscyllium plagiosum]